MTTKNFDKISDMNDKNIKITIINKRGKANCHRGHKIGDIFYVKNGKTPEGICAAAFNNLWPYIRALISSQDKRFEWSMCCPDPEVLLEFKIEIIN